jgi:hypothetical protein
MKGKIAGFAANALISLEIAKEKVWKSLEKAWKSLEFPWKSLDFPCKGLEKFGPAGGRDRADRGPGRMEANPTGASARALELSTSSVLSPLFDTIRRYNYSQAVVRLREMEKRS